MLQNDFYTTTNLQQDAQSIHCSISFNAAHAIFQGHFPGQPVVPGVCTMQIVKELLERQLDAPVQLSQAAQVKFLQLILPDVQPQVQISYKINEDHTIAVNTAWKHPETEQALFKMSGVYQLAVAQ